MSIARTPRQIAESERSRRRGFGIVVLAAGLALAACASPPQREPTQPAAVPTSPPVSRPSTQVYFYPTAGQSPEQQDRDRYECYLWAVKQTGFDPSQPRLAPHQRVEVVPMPPPGQNAAVGAVTGAVIGATISRPHNSVEGAVAGAVIGAVIGAAADTARRERAERVQERYDRRNAQQAARIEQQAQDYRRAVSACLEGRGYTVQ